MNESTPDPPSQDQTETVTGAMTRFALNRRITMLVLFVTILVVGFSAFAVGTTGALLTHFLWPESSLEWSVTPLPGADRMWGGAAVHLGGSF